MNMKGIKMNKDLFQDTLSRYLLFKLKKKCNKDQFELRLKILVSIADYLNLDIKSNLCKNASFIHPDHRKIIDKKWKQILKNNFQVSQEELNIYYRFTFNTLIPNKDIIKIIDFLANHDYIIRDGNEKFLKSITLASILSVDGFLGYTFDDLTNYVENLQTSKQVENNILDSHVKTVRQMYNSECIKHLSGNDAAALIFLSLLHIYEKHIKLSKFIELCKDDVDSYLLKKSKSDYNIKNAKDNMHTIINIYQLNMQNILKIANLKINQFVKFNNKL